MSIELPIASTTHLLQLSWSCPLVSSCRSRANTFPGSCSKGLEAAVTSLQSFPSTAHAPSDLRHHRQLERSLRFGGASTWRKIRARSYDTLFLWNSYEQSSPARPDFRMHGGHTTPVRITTRPPLERSIASSPHARSQKRDLKASFAACPPVTTTCSTAPAHDSSTNGFSASVGLNRPLSPAS